MVYYVAKMPAYRESKIPYERPREIAMAKTFEDAIHAADTFASEKFPFQFISKNAAWRKLPATDAQIAALNRSRGANNQLTADKTTKGKAGDMMTKVKHGIKGTFDKINQQRKKIQQVRERQRQVEERTAREQVHVGPVY